jgi:hypothetical protein
MILFGGFARGDLDNTAAFLFSSSSESFLGDCLVSAVRVGVVGIILVSFECVVLVEENLFVKK